MSGFWARFLLTSGTLASLLGISSACRAEKPAPWRRGPALLHLAAAREALSPASSRHWGLSYPVDEMYAGPWANSPFAHGAQGRAGAVPLERGAPSPASPAPGAASSQGGGRMVESALNGLGPLGLLASALIPAVVASSASAVAGGGPGGGRAAATGPRVGFAKLASGYGVVVSGRFY